MQFSVVGGNFPYLCQHVGVQRSGAMRVTEAVLPAARTADGRVFWPSQRIVPAHSHRNCSGGAAPALGTVQGRGQDLTPSQQQLPGTEVSRHWRRASLHHPAVPMAVGVIGASQGAAEQAVSSLPPVAVKQEVETR